MKIEVISGIRFEICYALAGRVAATRNESDPPCVSQAREFGEAFWLAVPDVLGETAVEQTFPDLAAALAGVPEAMFIRHLDRGVFHDDHTEEKREWLAYIGAEHREALLSKWSEAASSSLPQTVCRILLEYWRAEFEQQWVSLVPQLKESAERVRRLANVCSFAELATTLLLRIEVDEAKGTLRALRGGYELAMSDVGRLYLLPSAFNTKRLWHAIDVARPATVFAPYFDPNLRLDVPRALAAEFDPWLVCRALADPTRAAIVRRLAAGDATATTLVTELGLRKANVSHHLYQLREAGVIAEERVGRIVRVSLRTERIRDLSDHLLRELRNERSGQ
jgi:DNA-binding transcriptional ArsR family regulator